jgi:hypothetical protein
METKISFRVHKGVPLDFFLSQINAVNTPVAFFQYTKLATLNYFVSQVA